MVEQPIPKIENDAYNMANPRVFVVPRGSGPSCEYCVYDRAQTVNDPIGCTSPDAKKKGFATWPVERCFKGTEKWKVANSPVKRRRRPENELKNAKRN